MGSKIGCGNAFPLVRGVPVFQNAYRSFALLSGLFLFFIFGASAQTSSINATVTDATGAVVPGAKVTGQDAARNSTRTATTSGAGVYSSRDRPTRTAAWKGFPSMGRANGITTFNSTARTTMTVACLPAG